MLFSIWNSVTAPIDIAFKPDLFARTDMTAANYLIDILFIVDIIVNFRTSYTNALTGYEILDPKMIAATYLKGMFWIDLLSVLPFDLLIADFLEDPVPTTSPTKATGSPDSSSLLIVPIGCLKSVFFSIDKACKGISGLDQASGPGERSSVLISPSTFRTLAVIHSGTAGLFKNH